MSVEEKRAFLSLLIIIFNYHGLSEVEQQILHETAALHDALDELEWIKEYSKPSLDESYDKLKKYVDDIIGNLSIEKKSEYLNKVWDANQQKGSVSEMEATAMLMLSKDWHIQKEFIAYIREKKKTT
ncbi:MAG: hypothetical protein JWO58_2894 [Chitinophagaceae bacterium]|nr:hypothetical protein [Chitinophagaceae bacterium]